MKDPFSSDLTPQPVAKKKLLESDVQTACVAYARSKGFWARKFSSPSQRSVPDYLFGKDYGVLGTVKWAEEFKAPDKKSTDKQRDEQQFMACAGWYVIRDTGTRGEEDIEAFKYRIDACDAQRFNFSVPGVFGHHV